MTELERQRLILSISDMIKGEVNRICVTHDLVELEHMSSAAKINIERIRAIRAKEDFNVEGDGYDECK